MTERGEVAVVTGGSKGIGKAIAHRLSREGMQVAILSRSIKSGDMVAREIVSEGGVAIALSCDVTDTIQVRRSVDRVFATFGGVDVLVNNAGMCRSRPFLETSPDDWVEMIDLNYKGFLAVTHACLSHMIAKREGVIVNLGSDAGRVGTGGEVLYSGTKAAVMASSKALARELARHNIRVNCVSPGPVDTELLVGLWGGDRGGRIRQSITAAIPMKRIATPEDVADVVVFLAGRQAGYVTGQVLSVDGGLLMVD